jgi:clan AA aspartic protease (TIGR02281 family)
MRINSLRGPIFAMLTLIGLGNTAAQDFLSIGIGYANGQGVAKNDYEAVKWFRLAAEQGNALGQAYLGMMYGNGRGVRQDYVLSYMWLTLGQAHLPDVAANITPAQIDANLAGITTIMTPAQIDLAKKMASRCLGSNYKQCGYPEVPNTVHNPGSDVPSQFNDSATSVPMQIERGTYVVPVLINDAITLDFVVDSGAADVSIPADVVMTLMRTGTLKKSDFLGEITYVLADGSTVPSQTFRIRSLKVGTKVLQNVNGSVASVQGSLLLGQSFLSRFKSWSIDNTKHALLLSE